jgi:hypothetical protein
VREKAVKDKNARFTTLLHHVNKDLLRNSFLALKRQAVPGVDGITRKQYGERLKENLHTYITKFTADHTAYNPPKEPISQRPMAK